MWFNHMVSPLRLSNNNVSLRLLETMTQHRLQSIQNRWPDKESVRQRSEQKVKGQAIHLSYGRKFSQDLPHPGHATKPGYGRASGSYGIPFREPKTRQTCVTCFSSLSRRTKALQLVETRQERRPYSEARWRQSHVVERFKTIDILTIRLNGPVEAETAIRFRIRGKTWKTVSIQHGRAFWNEEWRKISGSRNISQKIWGREVLTRGAGFSVCLVTCLFINLWVRMKNDLPSNVKPFVWSNISGVGGWMITQDTVFKWVLQLMEIRRRSRVYSVF